MSTSVGLPEALERAASALPGDADAIRPANGDPAALLRALDAEAAVRVLDWLLRFEPEAGAELADNWAEEPDAASGPLPRLSGDALPKAGRKALSRALHRLRSRGIELAGAPPAAVVAKLPPIEEELEAAFVSAIDPRGTRLAYLVESNPAGGVRLFELVLDEERGILEFEVYATGRSKARQFLRDLRARERFPGRRVAGGRRARARPEDRRGPARLAPAAARLHRVSRPCGRAHARRADSRRAGARRPGRDRGCAGARARGRAGAAPRDRALAHGRGRAREARRADRRAGQEPSRGLPGGAPRAGRSPCSPRRRGRSSPSRWAPTPRSASRRARTCSGRPAARRTPGPVSPRRRPSARARRRRTRSLARCSRRCWLRCSPVWKSRRRARRSLRCS